jgi:enhancer of polycomb-like protein
LFHLISRFLPRVYAHRVEHHLQAAISAAAIRAAASSRPSASSPNARSSTSSAKPPPPISETLYHIPTPDATGIVSNYTDLYIPGRWHDPNSYVSFSDTVEETSAGPAGLGFVYTLDERDDEWLKNSNRIARGESTNGSASDAGRTSRKGKGRESEEIVPVISEDEFELVMALMEKWTDERFPTLHTVCTICLSARLVPDGHV